MSQWTSWGTYGPLARAAPYRKPKAPASGCSVYIISEGADGPCKIGRARRPNARMLSLQSGNARPLVVAGAWQFDDWDTACRIERELHEVFECYHLRGEWFDINEKGAIKLAEGYISAFHKIETAE